MLTTRNIHVPCDSSSGAEASLSSVALATKSSVSQRDILTARAFYPRESRQSGNVGGWTSFSLCYTSKSLAPLSPQPNEGHSKRFSGINSCRERRQFVPQFSKRSGLPQSQPREKASPCSRKVLQRLIVSTNDSDSEITPCLFERACERFTKDCRAGSKHEPICHEGSGSVAAATVVKHRRGPTILHGEFERTGIGADLKMRRYHISRS